MKVTELLFEKAPLNAAKNAHIIASEILPLIKGTEEMRANRGSKYDESNVYQLRIKPTDKALKLDDILTSTEKVLKSASVKKLGVTDVKMQEMSPNSAKYSSVSFKYGGFEYDIVVALGGNKGEDFEKALLKKMQNHHAGIDTSDEAQQALDALREIDEDINPKNILKIEARAGSTKRSDADSLEKTGETIADIIITLKKGGKRFISLKNAEGSTVANFGIGDLFNDDLTLNSKSSKWKEVIDPFGLEPLKMEEGFMAYRDGAEVSFNPVQKLNKKLPKTSAAYKLLKKLWGEGYLYLRQKGKSFEAMSVDADYVDNTLLKNLTVTEIRYPDSSRKQVTIYLTSASKKYKIELRNSKGKIKPTEMKFGIMSSIKN